MEKYFDLLQGTALFGGIDRGSMASLLSCMEGRTVEVAKSEPVFLEGDPTGSICVVLEGAVQIVRDDFYGNRSLMSVALPGDLFGEAFACSGVETMPVSAYATQQSKLLLLSCRKMLTVCSNACPFHNALVKNLLQVVAQKNMQLSQKILFMSQKTTRQKLMAYLLDQAKQQGSPEFTIALDRQGLADYLGVERSAMSAELGKLKRDGVLDCSGPQFRLLSGGPT